MSTNHEYTPTTQYLQNAYVDTRYNLAAEQGEFPPPIMERYAEFDRWLAEHDATVEAAAEQRGAIKALRDAADEFAPEWPDKPDLSATRGVSQTRKWLRNRADQMEGDE